MADDDGHPVKLYVYELSNGMARAMSQSLLGTQIDGIWHTSIVVGGVEYYYGQGIQFGDPGQTPFGRPLEIIDLGTTHVPKEVLEEFLVDMSSKYHPEAYSLLNNNCNNFSADLSQLLTGNAIPEHITNLPDVVRSSPLGPLLVNFLDSMEQRIKSFAQQGHTFRPDVQHVESYPTPDSYAGAMTDTSDIPGTRVVSDAAASAPPAQDTDSRASSASAQIDAQQKKDEFERRLRAEFDKLMEGGNMTPNEAAAQALRNVRSAT